MSKEPTPKLSRSNPWQEILRQLKPQLNVQTFESWLRPTRFSHIEGDTLFVQVPSAEFSEYINDQWAAQISALLSARTDGLARVSFLSPPVEVAPAQPEEEKELEEAPSVLPGLECPRIAEAAWHGLAQTYREVVSPSTEASDNYHLACFLTVVGAGLAKSVWFPGARRLYPNPYVVLVGETAWAAKGTAMGYASDLAYQTIPELIPLASIDSSEGTSQAIYDSIQQSEAKRRGTVWIQIDEFNALLAKALQKGSKIIPDLKRAFDSPEVLQLNTRYSRVNIEQPPVFVLLAASETEDLSDMTSRDVRGGLGNRILFVPGSPKGLNPDTPAPETLAWETLGNELRATFKFYRELGQTRFRWTEKAHHRWREFYQTIRARGADDRLVAKLSGRDRIHIPKIAMIYAALDRAKLIDLPHLDAATAFCDFLLAARYYIFRKVGLKPWVRDALEIVEYIRNRGGAISRRKVQARFWRLGPEGFERQMKYLLADSHNPDRQLRLEERGHTTFVIVNE